MMDPSKKVCIPTRIPFNNEEYLCSGKENVPFAKKIINKATSGNLKLPTSRHRFLSDTALLPSTKKAKIGVHSQKEAKLNRVPLGKLDGNLVQDVQKNGRIFKSILFKDVQLVIPEKLKKTTKQAYEKNTQTISSTSTSSDPITSSPTATTPSEKPFVVDRKFITVRKSLTPFPKSVVSKNDSYLDETFVDGPQHFVTFGLPEKVEKHFGLTISPISKQNECTTKSIVIFQGIPDEVRRPAKKKTLLHKIHPGLKRGNSEAYTLDIYNTEYLEDIVRCQMRNDWKYVLKINNPKFKNPTIIGNRAAVLNWLIRAQDYLNLSQSVLFTTIRLFDQVIEHLSVSSSMWQLVGLVIMWIVDKFEGTVKILTPNKLLTLCNWAFLYEDVLKMERKLLTFFKFDLKIPDVTVYITYYLKKLQIDSDLLLYSAFYILECYALNIAFSTVIPSIQAAAAVCLTLKIIYPGSNVWSLIKDAVCYYPEERLENVMTEMLQQLHRTQDSACEYNEPHKKYAVADKIQASIVLLRILAA